jgi:uncharacterized LabA/DUF88 family protein
MRAVSFIDGQNLYYGAKEAFGYSYPNYDVKALAEKICSIQGWDCHQIRFYTGIPDRADNQYWHDFWSAKLLSMSRQGVFTFARTLRYRNKTITLPDERKVTRLVGDEKGIDVRIALDVLGMAFRREYDVAVLFSQDQDLAELATELRVIAKEQNRWIKIASAFPFSPVSRNKRGIDRTDWIKIDRRLYEQCIDDYDYRPGP